MINVKSQESQPLFAEERQEQILIMLKDNSKLLVPELCNTFHVSPATIRNDLRDLESRGKLKRTHGGAIPVGKASFEPDTFSKTVKNMEEKQQIALYASELIEDGDTIALDSGTTMLELAKCLKNKIHLTVVTNDIKIASYLEENTAINIIMLGGSLRHGFECTVGPMTISALTGLNVDKAFLATNAFSIDKGFTTPDINQAEVKKAIIRSAAKIIMLCDSSKIGKISFIEFASIRDIDHFITDKNISQKISSYLSDLKDELDFSVV